MTPTRRKLNDDLYDHSILIQEIIWLAAQSAHQSNSFSDLTEDSPDLLASLLGVQPKEGEHAEEYIEQLYEADKTGYLVQARTPIIEGPAEHRYFSWSITTSSWFYFEEWDEVKIAAALCAWQTSLKPLKTADQ
jgi:hypothetical protein